MTLDTLLTIVGASTIGLLLAHIALTISARRRPMAAAYVVLLGVGLATAGFVLTSRSPAHTPLVSIGAVVALGAVLLSRRRARDGS